MLFAPTFAVMANDNFYKETYEQKIFTDRETDNIHFEACQFHQCDFSNLSLRQTIFEDCTFTECNFSNAVCVDTAFRDCHFIDSKLVGLQLANCHPIGLSVQFTNSNLSHMNAHGKILKQTKFVQCEMQEVDFSDANLEKAIFNQCELNRAVFQNTNLQHADLRTAYHYVIHPHENKVKKAIFDKNNLEGLLTAFNITIK